MASQCKIVLPGLERGSKRKALEIIIDERLD